MFNQRAGSNFKGLSPFHDEKRQVLWFLRAKQIWKRFLLWKRWKRHHFLMEIENFTYPEL